MCLMMEAVLDELTPREMEILQMIAEGLSNRDIAERLVISLETARWYSKQIYSKLGVHTRAEAVVYASRLGWQKPSVEAIPARRRTLELPKVVLPARATKLIGRQREVEEIEYLLTSSRCLTLTGPAGVGKTSLARQVAAEVLPLYADGVFFVELAPITAPNLVVSAIFDTLGLQGSSLILETLRTFLRDRHLLLVLDNYEHLMPAASLVSELLAAAPRLHILVTSREALRVYGEQEYMVAPLAIPDTKRHTELPTLSENEAVKLFVQRAKAARHDFELTEENAAAIAEICVQLDGLPLAIELAAARVKMFSPQALLARLDNRLQMLAAPIRDLPERQRALRRAIDWSYNLLTDDERTLFRRLGVFCCGRSIEAVEAICGHGLQIDVLDGLESLLNKSLLYIEVDSNGEPRFFMLQTISDYALEELTTNAEAQDIYHRHAEYFLNLAEQAAQYFRGHEEHLWMRRLDIEHENLRLALTWLDKHDAEGLVRMVIALQHFWHMRGYHVEGGGWLRVALEQVESVSPHLHVKLYLAAGSMAYSFSSLDQGVMWCQRALDISRANGDDLNTAWALVFWSVQYIALPDRYEQAMALCQEGLSLFRALNHKAGIAQALNILGELARGNGDYAAALDYYLEALPLTREIGEQVRVYMILTNLGYVAYHDGDYCKAEEYQRECLQVALGIFNPVAVAFGIINLAGAIAANGDPELATRLTAGMETYLESVGVRHQAGDQFERDHYKMMMRQQLGDDAFERAWAAGQRMTLDDAIIEVLGEEALLQ
jgi:predicted ATPase/DNA-binding CsgD family transcriptional regulator